MRNRSLIRGGLWVLLGVAVVAFILWVVLNFDCLSQYFTKDNPHGELFKVCLTAFAGIGVFITFRYLGKQVQAMEKGNVDTRFNTAVEHLGSNSSTIVLGGIHALQQIAVSDKNYTTVVHNLFCSYLRENSAELNKVNKANHEMAPDKCPERIQVLIDYLFKPYNKKESVYKDFETDLSYVELRNCNFNWGTLNNCKFREAFLTECHFGRGTLNECDFRGGTLTNCYFAAKTFTDCIFSEVTFTNCHFLHRNLTRCSFLYITLDSLTELPKGTEYSLKKDHTSRKFGE